MQIHRCDTCASVGTPVPPSSRHLPHQQLHTPALSHACLQWRAKRPNRSYVNESSRAQLALSTPDTRVTTAHLSRLATRSPPSATMKATPLATDRQTRALSAGREHSRAPGHCFAAVLERRAFAESIQATSKAHVSLSGNTDESTEWSLPRAVRWHWRPEACGPGALARHTK